MKRYCKDFKFTHEFILHSLNECLRTRWHRKDVAWFLAQYIIKLNLSDMNKYDLSKAVHKYIEDGGKQDIRLYLFPLIATEMLNEINNENIALSPIHYDTRVDRSSGKVRNIGISSIKQQVYDYIAVNAIKGMLLAKIGRYQCASLKYKGQKFGVKAIEKWIRKDPANTKYYCKEDIHHYYPSISHENIKKHLRRDIKNDSILYLLFILIDTYDEGLCIGSYLCQYLTNYYLSYVYHFIDNNCFSTRRNKRINWVSYKLFYMDDIILFSGNLKNLKKARKMINEYINSELNLEFKSDNNYHRVTETIDMMGYKINTKYTTIRRRNWKRIHRLFVRYKNPKRKMSKAVAHKIISYNGMVVNSNSVKINKKYKIKRLVNRAKEVIRCEVKHVSQTNPVRSLITSCFQVEKQTSLSMT